MATESSAIVNFVNLVEQERIRKQMAPPEVSDIFRESTERVPKGSKSRPLLTLTFMLAFGALTTAVGVYLGRTVLAPAGASEAAATDVPAAAAAPAPAEAAKPVVVPAAAEEVAPPTEPEAPAVVPAPVASAADTGFDLRTEPEGATVLLDGKEVGAAPLRVRTIEPGAHVIDVKAPEGYFSKRLEIEVEAGSAESLRVVLEPTAAADPEGPAVKSLEPAVQPLAAAEPVVEPAVAEPAKKAKRRSKKAARAARRAKRSKPAARPAPVAKAGKGTLMVGSKPPCDIYIDGKKTGLKTPQRAIKLSAGKHRITLVNNEFGIKKTFAVKIEAGEKTKVIKKLQ